MARIRKKLTKRLIDSLDPPATRADRYTITDTEDDGLRLRVFESGKKRFALEYRTGSRVRWFAFGTFGDMTVEQARKEAAELRARVAKGFDPSEAKTKERADPTFAEFASRWLERAKPRKKESSLRNDELLLRLYLLPAFGGRKLRDIRRADLERLRDKLAAKTTTANRVLALASTIFNAAEAMDERQQHSNPCRHVARYKENRKERPLAPAELGNLWAVLDTCDEAPAAVSAIRLLILTGLRCGEVLSLQWSDVDLEAGRLQLRDTKTGARRVVLAAEAVEILEALPRTSAYVFPTGKPRGPEVEDAPLADLTHPWIRIRKVAGLDDVRLHDLRHTFATLGLQGGLGLESVGKLLGHRDTRTTARYAHILEDSERRAANTTVAAITKAIKAPRLRVVAK